MKARYLLFVFVALLLTSIVWANIYPDKADDIESYSWEINANGFKGLLEYNLIGNRINGFLLDNPIEGYQVGRHIVFYRDSRANQIWSGWISDAYYEGDPTPIISGTFSHRGENSFPWHGVKLVNMMEQSDPYESAPSQ